MIISIIKENLDTMIFFTRGTCTGVFVSSRFAFEFTADIYTTNRFYRGLQTWQWATALNEYYNKTIE